METFEWPEYKLCEPESKQKQLIHGFIERVWNQGRFSELPQFLDREFVDYSIPVISLQNIVGLRLYLKKLRANMIHKTIINAVFQIGDLIICDFSLSWENHAGQGTVQGHGIFRIRGSKILHHWEILQ